MDYLAKSNERTTAGERVPVPPPKHLPVRGLAMWKKMPYDSKHPLQHRARMDLTLKCKELGESLYESYPNKNFELSGGPTPTLTYDSLHDPYLRYFFRSTHVFRNLLHRGLVTMDGRVKMKLPEFNAYRRYLYRLWVFHVNQLIREEDEEENKCYDQIFEAFERRNPYFEELFNDDDDFNADTFLAKLTVKLYENEDTNTHNPLIRSLVRWLQYEERLQKNYDEDYPAIRNWLRKQMRNRRMLENKINMRRSHDNYLRARWESLKVNSKETYERVTSIQEKQRTKFQMLSARRLNRARKMWARWDPSYMKKTPRVQGKLTTKASIDRKVFHYSKNVNLSEDWDDHGQTRNSSNDTNIETDSPAQKIKEDDKLETTSDLKSLDHETGLGESSGEIKTPGIIKPVKEKEVLDSDRDTAAMKKTSITTDEDVILKNGKGFVPEAEQAQYLIKETEERELDEQTSDSQVEAEMSRKDLSSTESDVHS